MHEAICVGAVAGDDDSGEDPKARKAMAANATQRAPAGTGFERFNLGGKLLRGEVGSCSSFQVRLGEINGFNVVGGHSDLDRHWTHRR